MWSTLEDAGPTQNMLPADAGTPVLTPGAESGWRTFRQTLSVTSGEHRALSRPLWGLTKWPGRAGLQKVWGALRSLVSQLLECDIFKAFSS